MEQGKFDLYFFLENNVGRSLTINVSFQIKILLFINKV